MRKRYSILFIACFAILFVFAGLFTKEAFCQEQTVGTIVKVPCPYNNQDVFLDRQKVTITVYSTFLQVDAQYKFSNPEDNQMDAVFGIPVYLSQKNSSDGQSDIIGLKVYKSKKEDLYVNEKTTKKPNFNKWYTWNVKIRGKGSTSFKLRYFVKLKRLKGIPNFTYDLSNTSKYCDNIEKSEIVINMPMDCEKIPFVNKKLSKADTFIYSSFPKPKVKRNILKWEYRKNHKFDKDLEISFYKRGFPNWEVECSEEKYPKHPSKNIIDGNISTYWKGDGFKNGQGTWIAFKPFINGRDGNNHLYAPAVKKIAIIPGNLKNLSSFYNYSHLLKGEAVSCVGIKKNKETNKKNKEEIKRPTRRKSNKKRRRRSRNRHRNDIIFIECKADPILQLFESKKPILINKGFLKINNISVYPGQINNSLCISEILIFDRDPKEIIRW